MPRPSPLHSRTAPLCKTWAFKEWAGSIAPCAYFPHSEREYFALRHTAGLLDVSPLYKLDLHGPGAGPLLSRVCTRDAGAISVGRVVYTAMADEQGKAIDDGTVARLGPQHFRLSSSEPWGAWLQRWGRGLDVRIEDTSARLAALAVQGPLSRDILRDCVDFDIDLMRWFRVRAGQIGGKPGWVSRTGYTGDLGFELWCDAADAPAVWDAVMAAGAPHGLDPVGLDALDVARIEAGYVLQGIDYVSARNTVVASQTSSPYEAGLGWTVELDRAPFVGQEPLRREAEAGSAWSLVGVELSWEGLEELYDSYGLPPHLAPVASRHSVPIYDRSARQQIGQITSSTWSPLLKRFLGIGQIRSEHANSGATVRVEHTVEHERRGVDATLVARPFFDPERKRSTPARAKKEAT